MTPCQKLGYKVGDKFRLISSLGGAPNNTYPIGTIAVLIGDDGTKFPWFSIDGKGPTCVWLQSVEKIEAEPEEVNDQEDRIFDALEKQKHFANLETSDGSTARYYELPQGATELQDLISERDMNAQIGEVFRACYRYGQVAHSDKLRDAKKIKFYAEAEIKRLENQGSEND